jgi:drug/metabolite transporter (DMT)-like permease
MNAAQVIVSILALAPWAGATVVATILVTQRLCRYQIARRKRPSFGTMLAGACCVPLFLVFVGTILDPDMWWPRLHKTTPGFLFLLLGCVAILCVFTAPWVVWYYQRRTKTDEPPLV